MIRTMFIAVLSVALASCAGSPFYRAEPFSAQVVDAQTGQPIEGAIVMARWELEQGAFFHGYHHMGYLAVKETVTDRNGRFSFDGFTRPNLSPLTELRGADPRVLVFKGGYQVQTYHGPIFADLKNRPGWKRKAAVDGWVLKLPKLEPEMTGHRQDQPQFHFNLQFEVRDIVRDCEWYKIPLLLVAMDEEKTRLLSLYPAALVRIGINDLRYDSKAECQISRQAVDRLLGRPGGTAAEPDDRRTATVVRRAPEPVQLMAPPAR